MELETAKTLLSEAGKFLEAQQRGMESLRSRLLDVARQATTLATLAVGAIATGLVKAEAAAPPAATAALSAAAAIWILTTIVAVTAMVPGEWFYAGRRPQVWWRSALLETDARATLLSMAQSSDAAIAQNDGRERRMARRLRIAVFLHAASLPAAAVVAGSVLYPMATSLVLALAFAVSGPLITALRR